MSDSTKGSRRRCLEITNGDPKQVAEILTEIVGMPDVKVGADDYWMPRGRIESREASLDKEERIIKEAAQRKNLAKWWLAAKLDTAETPNWDIAATCQVGDRKGLVLIEAKTHESELEAKGKDLPITPNGWLNDAQIGLAIAQANVALNEISRGWRLSRDTHYQLSNRIAWAWKAASLKIPIVLVYLGFLRAGEMNDNGRRLFASASDWREAVLRHSEAIVPRTAWGESCINVDDIPLWVIIRSRFTPIGS